MKTPHGGRRIFVAALLAAGSVLLGGGYSLLGVCGPFSDVTDAQFCPYVLEIFTLGITTGTTPTPRRLRSPASPRPSRHTGGTASSSTTSGPCTCSWG